MRRLARMIPGLFLAAASLYASACSQADARPEPEKKPHASGAKAQNADATRVEVAVLQRSDANLEVTMPAEIEGSRDATLASAQGGPIERVLVREGERVKAGQVLVRVDAALYGIQKQQSEIQLERAKRDFERSQGLGTALPAAERDRRSTEVRMLQSNLDLAELRLERAVIRAPFAGVVASLEADVGEVVGPATPLLRLVRLDPVHVVLSVPDRDVVALSPGMEVDVRVAAQPGSFKGRIARINPTGDSETRAFRAEVEVDNPDLLLMPGMIASVSVARTLAEGAVVIPQDWLVTRRDGVGVFVEEAGKARYLTVKPGRVVREQVVIEEGLAVGAHLVITGHRELATGDPLVVAREGRCCRNGRVFFE